MIDSGWCLVGHMAGDYLLQNDWMAANKASKTWVTAMHAAIWTACVVGLGGIPLGAIWAIAFLFGTHLAIDRFSLARKSMRYTGQEQFAKGMCSPWSAIVVDNTWHLLTIWFAARYLA